MPVLAKKSFLQRHDTATISFITDSKNNLRIMVEDSTMSVVFQLDRSNTAGFARWLGETALDIAQDTWERYGNQEAS